MHLAEEPGYSARQFCLDQCLRKMDVTLPIQGSQMDSLSNINYKIFNKKLPSVVVLCPCGVWLWCIIQLHTRTVIMYRT